MFIYDRQGKDIRVFAPDGKFVKAFARVGSGPGEQRDGDKLYLVVLDEDDVPLVARFRISR